MINLFEISINILEEFITVLFITMYFGCKYKNWKKYIGFILTIALSVSTITFFNSLYIYEGILGLTFIAIYFIYSLIFLKGDKYAKLFISGFINCIVYFLALFSVLLVSILSGQHISQLYGMTIERVILIAISKIFLIVSCVILLRLKLNNIAGRKNMIILIIMPIVVEISTIGIMNVFLENSELDYELLIATIGVMSANILTYYVFIKINRDAEKEAEIKVLQQKYESDRKHSQDIEELYSKTCGIRHDLLQHFTILKGLLDGNVDKAKDYLQSLTQNQLEAINAVVKTDNECFDAIVNTKTSICEKSGIDVQIRVMNNSLCKLKNDEIGVLFGNLFDNAIEAAKKSKRKIIELDVRSQGDNLMIFMVNSVEMSVLTNNQNLQTTKSDKEYHGFGIKNIKRIVNSHSGTINYYEENNCFCCDILI